MLNTRIMLPQIILETYLLAEVSRTTESCRLRQPICCAVAATGTCSALSGIRQAFSITILATGTGGEDWTRQRGAVESLWAWIGHITSGALEAGGTVVALGGPSVIHVQCVRAHSVGMTLGRTVTPNRTDVSGDAVWVDNIQTLLLGYITGQWIKSGSES